jgi:hypothetical protein
MVAHLEHMKMLGSMLHSVQLSQLRIISGLVAKETAKLILQSMEK